MATEAATDIKVDEGSITKPVVDEVKDETSEVVAPSTVETVASELEDKESAPKQSVEPDKSEESSSPNGAVDSSAQESSKESVDNEVVVKETAVSETVSEETGIVEKPQDSSGTDTVSVSEPEKVEAVIETTPQDSISDDSTTAGKEEIATTEPEQIPEQTNREVLEAIGSESSVATEVIDTKEVSEGAAVSEVPAVVTDTKEVTEGASVSVVPDVVAGDKEVSDVPSKISEENVPDVGVVEASDATPVTENPVLSAEEVKVEQEKPEDVVEIEKPPTDSASEQTPEPETTEVLPTDDKPDVVNDTVEIANSAPVDSSIVTETKEVDGGLIGEAADIVEKTDADTSAVVDAAPDVADVSEVQKEEDKTPVENSTLAETVETVAGVKISEVIEDVKASVSEALTGKKNLDGGKTEVEADASATVEATPDITGVAETAQTIVSEKVAEVIDDAKASVTEVVEASREFDVAGLVDKALATEGGAKEAEAEPKPTEVAETLLDKFVNETSESKGEEETEKAAEEGVAETGVDSGDAKTDEQAPKQENTSKSRNSNNIMSKVKQSIVKVKKAIIGKSPSSKTIQTDAKDDDTKAK